MLAHISPLFGTLVDGNPISFNLIFPIRTFLLQLLLFCCVSLVFYLYIKQPYRNNVLRVGLYRFGFFNVKKSFLWFSGFVGIVVQLLSHSHAAYGDVVAKFLVGVTFCQYFPIIMLFPSLLNIHITNKEKKYLIVYIIFVFLISLTYNSRTLIITPICLVALLFFLYLSYDKIYLFKKINITSFVVLCLVSAFFIKILSNISDAMLSVRGEVRGATLKGERMSRIDVLFLTMSNYSDDEKDVEEDAINTQIDYTDGWSEQYMSNFMFNRFGNMLVVDETLYYVDKVGYGNDMIFDSFINRVLCLFPTPFLELCKINIDKRDFEYSSGDILYLLGSKTKGFALGTYRVTSLVADGLATFGYVSFPIIMVLLYISFYLLDSFTLQVNGKFYYSCLGLVNVFDFFGIFRNSIGIYSIIAFILRTYWEICFVYFCVWLFYKFVFYRKI